MRKVRIIPRLDIKNSNLIKGIHLEGLRVVGDPSHYSQAYYEQGADELIYQDAVASLYERNSLLEMIEHTANEVFIPLTVGGGIRSLNDVQVALRSGADKISINTAAIKQPNLIKEIATSFGSQCVVVSIEAKKTENGWEVYTDNGREKTGKNVLDWVGEVQDLGAGEILLTSVDKEGTQRGFDIPLIKSVCDICHLPVIASGGMGELKHLQELLLNTSVDAVAIAHVLHYKKLSIKEIKRTVRELNIEVRDE